MRTSSTMAAQEQVQEALQRLREQEAPSAALETQLQIEATRSRTAEHERSALIQVLGAMRQDVMAPIHKGLDNPSF